MTDDQPASSTPLPHRRPPERRTMRYVLLFISGALVVNALVGDRGLLATLSAGRQHAELTARIAELKADNATLREDVRRLREDPAAIEAVARRELGLMRRGERLFVVRSDDAPAAPSGRPAAR